MVSWATVAAACKKSPGMALLGRLVSIFNTGMIRFRMVKGRDKYSLARPTEN